MSVTEGDCYPTKAEVRVGAWWAQRDNGEWVKIPDNKVLHERNPAGQEAHLCYSDPYKTVLCFVPPDVGE